MLKCDVIIPIYNSPEWVKFCVYALYKNTPSDNLGKVILVDDNSNNVTKNLIRNLQSKYPSIEVITNKENLGFVKNVNNGLKLVEGDYALLLNTDCLLSRDTIPKLMNHMESSKDIGLICPISSNAANLSLDIFENYSYMQVNDILEENFKGKLFDACTVVGNCLMISKECLDKVGMLDEIYGKGYGEETDYQFKCEKNGFLAKVAIDTYVFHKSEVSFGTSPEKQAALNKNRDIFFSRWGDAYNAKLKEYVKNDPIEYINKNLKLEKICRPEVLFFLPDIIQTAGGVHVVVDIVNYLNINGFYANILTERMHRFDEIMLFKPCFLKNIVNIKPKCIVATIYPTIFFCNTIAKENNIPMVNFMQGYEPCFDNGDVYGWAELACKNSQNILAISDFLKREVRNNFNKDSEVISNGINLDLIYNRSVAEFNEVKKDEEVKEKKKIVITMHLRGNSLKGDFILLDILKKLTLKNYNIEINVTYKNDIFFPINDSNIKINKLKGPFKRIEAIDILQKTDIFVDASFMEGFGLSSLEAMASGAVPVLAQSFGIAEYAIDTENSFVIENVNNSNAYVEKILYLIENQDILESMKKNALKASLDFDIDSRVSEYISYFKNVKIREVNLSKEDIKLSERWHVKKEDIYSPKKDNVTVNWGIRYKLVKLLPTSVKNIIKQIIGR